MYPGPAGVILDSSQPRWRRYDARARVALRCLAAWLRVPWRKLEALERMAALQVDCQWPCGRSAACQACHMFRRGDRRLPHGVHLHAQWLPVY